MVKVATQFHVPPGPEGIAAFVVDTDQIKLLKECKAR